MNKCKCIFLSGLSVGVGITFLAGSFLVNRTLNKKFSSQLDDIKNVICNNNGQEHLNRAEQVLQTEKESVESETGDHASDI